MTHFQTVASFVKTLRNLEQWMNKAEEHAKEKSFDVNVLIDARLAPDQFSFVKQVQAACDQAKYTAAYLGQQQAPPHADDERTFEELHARIAKCIAFIEGVAETGYAGSEERKCSPPWLGGAWLRGDDYVAHVAIPNFFFHATMAYAILRHNGVVLGKMDYIGTLPVQQG
jgi:uncharacterized protein